MVGFVRLEKTEIFFFICLSCALDSVFLDRSDRLTTAGSLSI